MANVSLEHQCERPFDSDPLLMEHLDRQNRDSEDRRMHEHVIDMSRGGAAPSSYITPEARRDNVGETYGEDPPPHTSPSPVTQPPASATVNVNVRRGENDIHRRRSPLNSGLWISVEAIVVMSQIVAAVVVLSLSTHEKPKTPLFEWVICYTIGCVATLPHLYWRYIHRNNQNIELETSRTQQDSSNTHEVSHSVTAPPQDPNRENQHNAGATSESRRNIQTANPRLIAFVDHFKMALDFFFAVWFVVGNIWVFGRRFSPSDAPNLYRLCVVFLTFSCIGYAMPFILCATICCCLPCIISLLGIREDMTQNRGATSESIDALPTYNFTTKRKQNGESETNSDGTDEGGILAADTDKERRVSAEDAVCCICLARYADNDVLRELPCTHFFHVECVDKWLKINALCPLCKANVGEAAASAARSSSSRRHG